MKKILIIIITLIINFNFLSSEIIPGTALNISVAGNNTTGVTYNLPINASGSLTSILLYGINAISGFVVTMPVYTKWYITVGGQTYLAFSNINATINWEVVLTTPICVTAGTPVSIVIKVIDNPNGVMTAHPSVFSLVDNAPCSGGGGGGGGGGSVANPSGITASINPLSAAGETTTLTVQGGVGTTHWYTGSCGGTEIGTGSTIDVSPSEATTYYAKNEQTGTYSTGCASIDITISEPVVPADPTGISTAGNVTSICNGGSIELTAEGIDGTVHWFTGSCGGTEVGTGNTYTASPTTTTTYYCANELDGTFSDGCASLQITVNNPPSVANTSSSSSSTWCNGNATLNGTISSDGGSTSSWSSGFRWGTDASLNSYNTASNGSGAGSIAAGLSGLTGGTTYYYRAFAGNSCGVTLESTIHSFIAVNTPDMSVTSPTFINTLSAGDYTSTDYTTVMLEGNCTNVRGENLNSKGFYYSIYSANTDPDNGEGGVTTVTNASGAENTYGTGMFTNNITSLQSGTKYAFKSFGTHSNCVDEGKSAVSTFWTLAYTTMDSPTNAELTHNSVDYTITIANTGTSNITEYGVVYARKAKIGTGNYPLIGGTDCIKIAFWNGNNNAIIQSSSKTVGGDNFNTPDYTDANTGNPFLYSNTTYYIRPYTKNDAGTFYGTVQEILTDDAPSEIDGQIASISLNNEAGGSLWDDNNSDNSNATVPSGFSLPSPNVPDPSLSNNNDYANNSNDSWQSWTFDGSNDAFQIPYNTNSGRLNNNSEKSLFIYFRTENTVINNRQVLVELASSNSGLNVYIYSGKIWAGIWNSTQRRYFSKSITSNTNYLFNLEFNGTKVRTALNGECSSSMLFSGFAANSNLNGVGASINGTRYMDMTRGSGLYDFYKGKIADILMYNDCSQTLRTNIMNFFDQKYGNTFRNNYTAYFGKVAAESNWTEYELEVSPFDNNDNLVSNLEVYKSQKDLMINLNLDESENIELAIFDLNGIKVGTISNSELKKGINNFAYSTENLISGVYIVRAIGLNINESVKVNIMK